MAFPTSPVNGQTYTLGGVYYTYNSSYGTWNKSPLSNPTSILGNSQTFLGTTYSFSGNTNSTSTTSGTMVVTGGVGVSGNVYAGNVYSNGTVVATATAIDTVSNAVSLETINRVSADNALSVRIDTVSNAVSIVSNAVSVETANRVSADNALSVRVDTVSNAVSVVSNALSVEITNRTSADNALSVRIDTVSNTLSALSNLVSGVSNRLSVEIADRVSAVNALSNSVSATYAPKANPTFTGTTNIAALNVSGDTVLTGNLTVNGTQEIVNSTTVTINDKNIVIGNNASTSATIDGGGIDVGAGPVTYLRYIHANLGWYTANNFGVGGTLTVNGINIQTAIDTVSNAVSVVSNALSVETAARIAADNSISNAVSVVSNALSAEIVNRVSADNALSNLISALSNSVSVTYAPKANPTFTGTVTLGNITVSANNTSNIGTVSTRHNTIFATTFNGTATTAQYADLAEIYAADQSYEPGTAVIFGGSAEITKSVKYADTRVAGIISTDPAFLMNESAVGLPVALRGRVPAKVYGPVSKGDLLVTAGFPGCLTSTGNSCEAPLAVIAKSLENSDDTGIKTIEVVLI
jgi:cytoskeletal protein CcmA (bactofilin family)